MQALVSVKVPCQRLKLQHTVSPGERRREVVLHVDGALAYGFTDVFAIAVERVHVAKVVVSVTQFVGNIRRGTVQFVFQDG